MANLLSQLRRPTTEVTRYTLSEYLRQRAEALTQWGGGGYGSAMTIGGKPVESVPNSYADYATAAYASSSVVGACMRVRRDIFRQARFTWREVTDDGVGRLYHSDELDVLEVPWTNGTSGELLTRMITDVDLCGNSFIVNEGIRLRWRRPDWMYVVLSGDPMVDDDVDVVGYLYTPGGGDFEHGTPYLTSEVCHFSPIPDPLAQYRGMSWMTSALRDIQGDKAATEHKLSFFTNGATLGPIFRLPASMTKEQFKKFMEITDASHVGPRNAYKPLYVGGGAEVTLSAASFQQLELKATQGAGETRVAALAGVHPAIVGLSEGLAGSSLNAGNFSAARRLVADVTMMPLWQDACAALSTFVKVPDGAELWIRERAIPFLREDAKDAAEIFSIEAESATKLVREGYEPDSVTPAVSERNILLLKHSGLTSVQLQKPGQGPDGDGGSGSGEGDGTDSGAQADQINAGIDKFLQGRSGGIVDDELQRRFNPAQPRDPRGRWSLTGAVMAALKAAGGEQGGASFAGGRYFDWSSYDPATREYALEIGEDVNDPDAPVVAFSVSDYDLEQLFNALTVTRIRDRKADRGGSDPDSVALAALSVAGHSDHIVFSDESYIDWSTRTPTGDYGFGIENDGESAEFDLTPAEVDKLTASLALSTQAHETTRARFDPAEHPRNPKGAAGGGRFRSLAQRVLDALTEWDSGGRKGDPFGGIDREPLRQVAVKRGLSFRRGASRDEIVDALKADLEKHGANVPERVPAKKAVKKAAPAAPDLAADLDSLRKLDDPEKIRDALDLKTVPQLKVLLGQEGLGKSGRKRDLVDRLVEHISPSGEKAATPELTDEHLTALERLSVSGGQGLPGGADLPADHFRPGEDIEGLRERGLVERLGGGREARYRITNKGRAALDAAHRAPADKPDLEEQARIRQREIDAVKPIAATLAEVDGLLDSGVDADVLRRRIEAGNAPEPLRTQLLDAAGGKAAREIKVENKIRAAYAAVLDRKPNKQHNRWVGLAGLRDELGESINRHEIDAALTRMGRGDYPHKGHNLIPESYQSALRPQDREAAVHFGGQDKHLITIDDPSPRPMPTVDPAKIRAVLDKAARDAGLIPIGQAGTTVAFDRKLHTAVGGSIPDGAPVEVIKQGYEWDRPGEGKIRLSKADVVAAEPAKTTDGPQYPAGQHSWSGHDGRDVTDAEERDFLSLPLTKQAEIQQRIKGPQFTADSRSAVFGSHPDHSVQISPQREAEIRAAVEALVPRTGLGWVTLQDIREGLGDRFPRAEVDHVLVKLNRSGDWHVVPEANQKALTPRERLAAVVIGNQDKHALWVVRRGEPPPAASAPGAATRRPATPTPIHALFAADDATIETALRDVFEGQFGPYTTKATVTVIRAGTRTDKKGRQHQIDPSISVKGKIYDADGTEIGYFGRSISPVELHYADGTVRRELWARHSIVQLGGGDYDTDPTKYHGTGFGREFNARAIDWYRASGVHGIGQSDHNGYVWASQGFNFGQGGRVPDYLAENIRTLVADLRAGKTTSRAVKDEYQNIPKSVLDAPDLDSQISAAEALLDRIARTEPGQPDYPTAYEISQLGRRPGQRGKTEAWLGKLLSVSADEMILNPDEGEVISS